jgi:hypothetical protein
VLRGCGGEQRTVVRCNDARRAALTQREGQTFCGSLIESAEGFIGDQQIRSCDERNKCRSGGSLATTKGAEAAIDQGKVNCRLTRDSLNVCAHLLGGNVSRLQWQRGIIEQEWQRIRRGGSGCHVPEARA